MLLLWHSLLGVDAFTRHIKRGTYKTTEDTPHLQLVDRHTQGPKAKCNGARLKPPLSPLTHTHKIKNRIRPHEFAETQQCNGLVYAKASSSSGTQRQHRKETHKESKQGRAPTKSAHPSLLLQY